MAASCFVFGVLLWHSPVAAQFTGYCDFIPSWPMGQLIENTRACQNDIIKKGGIYPHPYWALAKLLVHITTNGHRDEQEFTAQRALDLWREGVAKWPENKEFHRGLCDMCLRLGMHAEAIIHYEQSQELFEPLTNYNDAHAHLMAGYQSLRKPDRAQGAYVDSVKRGMPRYFRGTMEALLALPASYSSEGDFKYWRHYFGANLIEFWQTQADFRPVNDNAVWFEFGGFPSYSNLAPFGYNDAPTVNLLTMVIERAAPSLRFISPHLVRLSAGIWGKAQPPGTGAKIKVGFMSRYLYMHPSGKMMAGIIPYLSRQHFEVVLISTRTSDEHVRQDATAQHLRERANAVVDIVLTSPADARSQLIELHLDILVFCELGLEPYNWMLAFARIAPVQVATHGHAYTSGQTESLDYYVSYKLFEGKEAQRYYSERLVTMKGLVKYGRPSLPTARSSRIELGLPEHGNIYLCVQKTHKITPEFDEVWSSILLKDPQGHLIFRQDWHEDENTMIGRLRRRSPEVVDRVRFVHSLPDEKWFDLFRVSSVMVDAYPFGGYTTSLEALSLGLPIVTLPHSMLGGKATEGFLVTLDMLELVALSKEDYVDIAVRVASDGAYRARLSADILARNAVLYDDDTAVADWEQFMIEAVARKPITNRHGTDEEMNKFARWSDPMINSEAIRMFPRIDWSAQKLLGALSSEEERALFHDPEPRKVKGHDEL